MNHRTASKLAAFLLVSCPWAPALAQPAPDKPPADAVPAEKPPPDSPSPEKAAADKAAADKAAAEKAAAEKAAADKAAADQKLGPSRVQGSPHEPQPPKAQVPILPTEGAEPVVARPITFSSRGFSAWPIALIQAQVTPYVGKNVSFAAGDIAERPGFRLRRARFGVGGTYESMLEVKLTGELNTDAQATITLHDAWFGVRPWKALGAYMGILEVPYSRSAMGPTAATVFVDRPLAVRAMAPYHQLGMLVSGSVASGKLQYAAGVFNGFERFDLFYSGYKDSLAALGNRFDNLAYVARVATSILSSGPEIAVYGDYHDHLDIGASYFFNDGGARNVHSVEGDIFFQKSGVRLLGEVLYSTAIPESQPTTVTTQTAPITSYAIVFEGGYTFQRTLGAHLRFEWIDPNTVVQDAADNWLLTAVLAFQPPVVGDYVKAQLEFTHREEVHAKSLDNDSLTLQTQFVLQ